MRKKREREREKERDICLNFTIIMSRILEREGLGFDLQIRERE